MKLFLYILEVAKSYQILVFEREKGDYIVIPRGVTWQFEINKKWYLLIIESKSPVSTPNRYRNEFGQLEHAPFCERDIYAPDFMDPLSKKKLK